MSSNYPPVDPTAPISHARQLLVGVAALAVLGVAVLAPALSTPQARPPVRAQEGSTTLYAPDLHSKGYTTAPLPAALPMPPAQVSAAAPAGIEGFGFSALEMVNLGTSSAEITFHLSKRGRNQQTVRRDLPAGGSEILRLGRLRDVDDGFWNGRITAPTALGGVARSDWGARGNGPSGGTLIYQTVEPGRGFLLPLFVRGVDELYSVYYLMNADESGQDRVNDVTLRYFNAIDGGIEAEWHDILEPGGVIDVDSQEIGTALTRLPTNLPLNGFVGGFHIESEYPVSVLVLHNESFEGGVGAAVVRTWDHAVTEQHLPIVRANVFGDTLIGLVNRENSAVDVTVEYRGMPDSPSQAGQTIEQQLTMAARSSASIDLGDRGMGTAGASGVTRGAALNQGFLGSARIRSTGRVQASVLESSRWMTITRSTAAWNPFTADDLHSGFVVPAARHTPGQRVTQLAIHNPGSTDVMATVAYEAMEGDAPEGQSVEVPAGQTRLVTTEGDTEFVARATVSATGQVAVLVYETPFTSLAAFDDRDNLLDVSAYAAIPLSEEATPGETPGVPTPTGQPSETPLTPEPGETPTATTEPGDTPTPPDPDDQPTIWLPWANR